MSNRIFAKTFAWISQNIFRSTKQKTGQRIQLLSITSAVIKQSVKFLFRVPLKLQPPNSTISFPLTNRWSNPNPKVSQQELYMVIKQVGLTLKKAGIQQKVQINSSPDRSKQNINVMHFLSTYSSEQIDQINKIVEKFQTHQKPIYNLSRQTLYAQSHINGQHSFNLRKYNQENPQYQIAQSRTVQENYINALKKAIETEKPNQANLQAAGLTYEQFKNRLLVTGEGVYSMLFEDLENISKGNIINNTPTIYLQNLEIKDTYYLQAPYPVYMRIKNSKGDNEFICAAIGFRYNNGEKIRFFSPFFSSQQQKVWRLAQSHLSQAIFNDFHVRVHLGIYHFTTNQYNVPIYNYLKQIKHESKQNYENFLNFSYSVFNRGLEGVNVSATASLVHPIAQYSLVNRVFNLSQANAVGLIAATSNRLDFRKFSPLDILQSRGISKDMAEKDLDRLNLDIRLYSIISRYIRSVYEIFEIDHLAQGLRFQINHALQFMGVGGANHRPGVNDKEQLLTLLTNVMYCWVGYHVHTFSTIVLANYWHFRPSIIKKPIPYDSQLWKDIVIGQQIPDTKILMQSGKLTQTTTQRQTNNELIAVFKALAFKAHCKKQTLKCDNKQKAQTFQKLKKVLNETVKQLQQFGDEIDRLNKKRVNSLAFTWMHPVKMQTSLNI